jgi:hypothetical protein
MKTREILTIIAISVLGLSLILYIVTRLVKSSVMKVKLTHTSSFLVIIAAVLLAISQFISETQEPMDIDKPPKVWDYKNDICWMQQAAQIVKAPGQHKVYGRKCKYQKHLFPGCEVVRKDNDKNNPPHCMCGSKWGGCTDNVTKLKNNLIKLPTANPNPLHLNPMVPRILTNGAQEQTTCGHWCNYDGTTKDPSKLCLNVTIDPAKCVDMSIQDPDKTDEEYQDLCAKINGSYYPELTLWCGTTDVENQ